MRSTTTILVAVGALLGAACAASEPAAPAATATAAPAPELWAPWIDALADGAVAAELEQARASAAAGGLERVLDRLDVASERHPAEPAPFAARAALFVDMGFPRAAEHQLEVALSLAPRCEDLWRELARVRKILGLPTGADEAQRHARRLALR